MMPGGLVARLEPSRVHHTLSVRVVGREVTQRSGDARLDDGVREVRGGGLYLGVGEGVGWGEGEGEGEG